MALEKYEYSNPEWKARIEMLTTFTGKTGERLYQLCFDYTGVRIETRPRIVSDPVNFNPIWDNMCDELNRLLEQYYGINE
jgi:hypothetical protein